MGKNKPNESPHRLTINLCRLSVFHANKVSLIFIDWWWLTDCRGNRVLNFSQDFLVSVQGNGTSHGKGSWELLWNTFLPLNTFSAQKGSLYEEYKSVILWSPLWSLKTNTYRIRLCNSYYTEHFTLLYSHLFRTINDGVFTPFLVPFIRAILLLSVIMLTETWEN